jgi:DNA polymerase-3 subunit alpha (Gram-positive type)
MMGVVVDVETTGFSKNDSIISISLLKFTGPRIDDLFSTLVNPGRLIPAEIVELTGITNNMVIGFPCFNNGLTIDIKRFIGMHKLFAYNAPFEAKFMKNIYYREIEVEDVMNPIRKHFKFDKNKKLKDVAKYFRLETRDVHNSLNDALICFNLINILNRAGYRW